MRTTNEGEEEEEEEERTREWLSCRLSCGRVSGVGANGLAFAINNGSSGGEGGRSLALGFYSQAQSEEAGSPTQVYRRQRPRLEMERERGRE